MEAQLIAALQGRMNHARGLLSAAEASLGAREPEALVTHMQDLVRSLRPLSQVPTEAWRAAQIDPHDLTVMGRRAAAMQEAVARALASTVRERQMLSAGAAVPEGPATALYAADGRAPGLTVPGNRPAGAVA